jgi:hypothetical protein
VAVGVHPVCYPHAALEGSSGPRAGDDGRLSSPQRIAGAPCSVQAVGAELPPIHRSMWSVGPLESSRACTLRRHESSVLAARIPGVLTTTTASHHSRRLGRVPTIITTSPTALLCSPFCFVRGIESVRSRDLCYRKKHPNQHARRENPKKAACVNRNGFAFDRRQRARTTGGVAGRCRRPPHCRSATSRRFSWPCR